MKKITKKAFTMAEVLMVLAVLGIIAAILIPAIAAMKPDQNRVMFKKAYYLTERLIAEIVNDEELYTSGSGANEIGFVRMHQVDTMNPNTSSNPISMTIDGTVVGGTTAALQASKLCLLFKDRLNLITEASGTTGCGSTNTFSTVGVVGGNNPNFKTVDGIWWYFPAGTGFNPATTPNGLSNAVTNVQIPTASQGQWTTPAPNNVTEKIIMIDTNGSKKPNCRCLSADANHVCTSTPSCKKPDRFVIIVRSDGKMRITGPKEIEYLKAASTVSDK